MLDDIPYMKSIFLFTSFSLLCWLSQGCVSGKKFKTLKTEQARLSQTLYQTKTELSDAKLALNKLEDASSSANESQTETIQRLKAELKTAQQRLRQAQNSNQQQNAALQNLRKEQEQLQQAFNQKIQPFNIIQNNLQQQNQALRPIKKALDTLKAQQPDYPMEIMVGKGELILNFPHQAIFGRSSSYITKEGRNHLYALATILQRYPDVYLDIHGHTSPTADSKEDWKNTTRKSLAILYTLVAKEVPQERMKVIGHGAFDPINPGDNSPEATQKNKRISLFLHYQNQQLLKLIPLENR